MWGGSHIFRKEEITRQNTFLQSRKRGRATLLSHYSPVKVLPIDDTLYRHAHGHRHRFVQKKNAFPSGNTWQLLCINPRAFRPKGGGGKGHSKNKGCTGRATVPDKMVPGFLV